MTKHTIERHSTTSGARPDAAARPPIHARYDRPWLFFVLATAGPWAMWIPAAWLSHRGEQWMPIVSALGVAGLFTPLGVVAWMTRHDAALRRDVLRRLVNFREVRPIWWFAAIGTMPLAILIATTISLAFGYSPEQFGWRGGATFAVGALSGWFALALAPVAEELAWHSYGTDALRTRFSIFTASMVFIPIWAVWHLPLAFISGSSQAETAEQGLLHALNFPLSMIPFVLLMNWIYYRSGRNITVTILFHLSANLITQILATHPDTEVLATGVLLLATAVAVWAERRLFFAPPVNSAALLR